MKNQKELEVFILENEKVLEFINQGKTLAQMENYSKAKEYFQTAISLDKHNVDAYLNLGNVCANLSQFDEALLAFEKVKLLDVDNGENYFNIGNIYILKDNLLKAIENYNKAEEKGFNNIELYANLAGMYRQLGETQQAIRNLTKAIKVAPLRGDIRVEKAYIYIELGKFQEALETLEDMQKIIPDAFEAYDLQTQIYCGLGKYEKALEIITGATKRFENDVVLQWIKIKVLVEMKKFDEAKKEIIGIKQKRDYPNIAKEVSIQESIIHTSNNDIHAGIKALESALEYENEKIDEDTRYLLMNLYVSIKDYERAIDVAKVLEDTKSESLYCISAMYYIPYIWKLQNKTEESFNRFKELVSKFRKLSIKHPNFYELYMYRVLSHTEIKEYDKALELAEYIEDLFPERFDAFALRYTIYTAMGETEKAEEARIKAKELNPDLNI